MIDKLFFIAVSGDGEFWSPPFGVISLLIVSNKILHLSNISSSPTAGSPLHAEFFWLCKSECLTSARRLLIIRYHLMLRCGMLIIIHTHSNTFLTFAFLSICNLLEQWTQEYPNDFAVPGAAGALNALIKQILRQTHTLYYGSDLLPFIEMLPTIQDLDSAWAMPESSVAEDDSDSNYDVDGHSEGDTQSSTLKNESILSANSSQLSGRDRKASFSLSAKAIMQTPISSVPSPTRDMISRLAKTSNALLHFDSDDVAKEITRRELELYMAIEPRDWLRHTLVSGKKDPNHDRIARFNSAFNGLHDWSVSSHVLSFASVRII